MPKVLGIDLGTTFSEMAVLEGGQPRIIENSDGERTTPSVVAIAKNGERLVGNLARRQAITNPKNTIYAAKRLIGRRFSDPTVQNDRALLSYDIRKASDGGVEIKLGDSWVRPQQISAMVLQKLKADAEAKLGEKIEEAVITCPAYFDDGQRKATQEAGEIAGFKVLRLLNEPTAAALAYGLDKKKNQQILVYDFGGGTFDVSILNVSQDTVEVMGTGGDTHLGGEDFDQKMMDWVIEKFKKEEGVDLSKDPLAMQRIKEACEKAKRELSSSTQTEINLPFITSDSSGPKHLNYSISRSQLEQLVMEFVDRSIKCVEEALSKINLSKDGIEEIVLVGGQTRMPLIQERVKEFFGKEPNKDINPDEVVAVGASVQGGILKGEMKDVLLLDVTPLSLGIETMGSVNTVLIPKNTTIPTSKSQIFSTASDSQTSVQINVLQGERPMARDNKLLGTFILDGIPPAPRGVPQIEVSFDIDASGILQVSAKDKATGKQQTIRIESSTGMSKDEIERLKKEAEQYAEADRKKRELAEAKNQAETLVYTADKALRDAGDKVSKELKDEVEQKKEELKKVIDGNSPEDITKKADDLSQTLQKIGAQMYQQKGPEGGAQPGAGEKAK